MSDVSVIGLGAMGSALARVLMGAGRAVTVWNRSPGKAEALAALGARGAGTAADAFGASPVVLICVAGYAATEEIVAPGDAAQRLAGRTVVQLSTGTPKEAQEAADWFGRCDADYLDGAIHGGPQTIGTPDGHILVAGPEAAFARAEPLLRDLAADVGYLGPNIRAASALATLCHHYGRFLGLAHGALLCESEGVGLDLYAALFPEGDRAHQFVRVVHEDAFGNPPATLSVWAAALRRILEQASDAGISGEIPAFAAGLFDRAIAAGHGKENVAALVKVLRGSGNPLRATPDLRRT